MWFRKEKDTLGKRRARAMQRMLRDIEEEALITSRLIGRRRFAPRVMEAIRETPRHRFIDARLQAYAYDNRPLSIGNGQTISQPYIVALMTDLLDVGPDDTVLEIGTGSGYQTAVLSRLAAKVYSVEVIPELALTAADRLKALGCDNVEMRTDNGRAGWPEHAPYDAIMVTAAAPEIPQPLIRQLKAGGRMVLPVGACYSSQDLVLIEKDGRGEIIEKTILPVAFVPLTGDSGEPGNE
jgi:protein-L-isoaspartate(D-aspartate) O-methyltransferase